VPFQPSLQQVQQHIDQQLSQLLEQQPLSDPRLLDAMKHSVLLGGKRLRPYLVYATGRMLGADSQMLEHASLAIELIHCYSLIHDDLPAMDDDALRRGHPTCHVAFDEATAILAGDALQSLAFEVLAAMPLKQVPASQQVEMIHTLAQASGYRGMCGGQALDLAATGQSISLEQLEGVHNLKTGALIRAAVKLGALCAPSVSTHVLSELDNYAANIGLAFQVQDDILDIVSDTQTLGKPQGSDQAQDKSTYPALLGMAAAEELAETLVESAYKALDALPYEANELKQFAQYIIQRHN